MARGDDNKLKPYLYLEPHIFNNTSQVFFIWQQYYINIPWLPIITIITATPSSDLWKHLVAFSNFVSQSVFTLVLTWSLYVLLFIIPNYIKSSLNSTILNIIGITLYVLCIISYYKIILIGPGSPLDYPELRINDLNRMINEIHIIIITMMKNQEIYHQNQ